MSQINFDKMCQTGIYVGLGVVLTPLAITSTIACSKIILVNIIADIFIRILTAGYYTGTVTGVTFVQVPLLWKVSFLLAGIGTGVATLSVTALVVSKIYLRLKQT